MKTAISIPDSLFQLVEQEARRLGLNRSEFFARAAEAFIRSAPVDPRTVQLDAALEEIGDTALDPDVKAASRALLERTAWSGEHDEPAVPR